MFLMSFKSFLKFFKSFFYILENVLCFLVSYFLFLLKHKRKKLQIWFLFFMGKLRSAVFDLYIQNISVFSLYKWQVFVFNHLS